MSVGGWRVSIGVPARFSLAGVPWTVPVTGHEVSLELRPGDVAILTAQQVLEAGPASDGVARAPAGPPVRHIAPWRLVRYQ